MILNRGAFLGTRALAKIRTTAFLVQHLSLWCPKEPVHASDADPEFLRNRSFLQALSIHRTNLIDFGTGGRSPAEVSLDILAQEPATANHLDAISALGWVCRAT
jgi:hypothetical protein